MCIRDRGKTIRLELQNQYEEFEIIGVVASGGNLLQNVLSGYIPDVYKRQDQKVFD